MVPHLTSIHTETCMKFTHTTYMAGNVNNEQKVSQLDTKGENSSKWKSKYINII
jgi:hypothetical protein